jgi:hypothetical protein
LESFASRNRSIAPVVAPAVYRKCHPPIGFAPEHPPPIFLDLRTISSKKLIKSIQILLMGFKYTPKKITQMSRKCPEHPKLS